MSINEGTTGVKAGENDFSSTKENDLPHLGPPPPLLSLKPQDNERKDDIEPGEVVKKDRLPQSPPPLQSSKPKTRAVHVHLPFAIAKKVDVTLPLTSHKDKSKGYYSSFLSAPSVIGKRFTSKLSAWSHSLYKSSRKTAGYPCTAEEFSGCPELIALQQNLIYFEKQLTAARDGMISWTSRTTTMCHDACRIGSAVQKAFKEEAIDIAMIEIEEERQARLDKEKGKEPKRQNVQSPRSRFRKSGVISGIDLYDDAVAFGKALMGHASGKQNHHKFTGGALSSLQDGLEKLVLSLIDGLQEKCVILKNRLHDRASRQYLLDSMKTDVENLAIDSPEAAEKKKSESKKLEKKLSPISVSTPPLSKNMLPTEMDDDVVTATTAAKEIIQKNADQREKECLDAFSIASNNSDFAGVCEALSLFQEIHKRRDEELVEALVTFQRARSSHLYEVYRAFARLQEQFFKACADASIQGSVASAVFETEKNVKKEVIGNSGFKSRDEFQKLQEDGTLEFGQVPMLRVEPHGEKGSSFQLVQSACILRTMARLAPPSVSSSLYPSDPIQAHKVDALLDFEADAFTGLRVAKYKMRYGFSEDIMNDAAFASTIKVLNEKVIPRHLTNLSKILGENQWLAGGENPSIADFFWCTSLNALKEGWSKSEYDLLEKFPNLESLRKRFYALSAVKNCPY
eukprot:g112.t1